MTPRKQLYSRLTSPTPSLSLSYDEIAQASHVAIAFAVVAYACARFVGHPNAKYIAAAIVVAGAAIKEFWWDRTYETPATRGSDLEDWSYYVCGVVVALLTLWGV